MCVSMSILKRMRRAEGDANILISASDSEQEIASKIEKAVFAAGFVKNKWYDLPEDVGDSIPGLPVR